MSPARNSRCFANSGSRSRAPATNTLTMHALLEFGKRDRRVPLHHPSARDDDHRHRNDADRARCDRQVRHRRDGGGLPLQRPRPPPRRRLARRRLRSDRPADPVRATANGCGGRSPIAKRCRSPPSPTSIRAASDCCSARGPSTRSTTTRAAGNCVRRSGSNRSATGATATCGCSRSPLRPRTTPTSSRNGVRRPGIAAGASRVARLPAVLVLDAAVAAAACDLHVESRSGKIGRAASRFAVEMTGDVFADPQKAASATARHSRQSGQDRLGRGSIPTRSRRSVRVVFDLDPGRKPIPSCG